MNSDQACFDRDELRAFGLGMLDDARSQLIADHLTGCSNCEATLAGCEQSNDPLVQSVRQAALADSPPGNGRQSGNLQEPPREESSGHDDPAIAEVLSRAAQGLAEQLRQMPIDRSGQRFASGEQIRDYRLLEPLGTGGMGTVFRAIHTRLDRVVALKTLPPGRLRSQAALARFEREMKAIGRLNHPAIVRATDAGEEAGVHFLAMDFVDGLDVSKLVRTLGPLDSGSACEIIRQAALGLQYAHDEGFVHRDVKPGNLMLEADPQLNLRANRNGRTAIKVRVLDLGIALFGAASEAVDELTTIGQFMGTLDYMAPEQADSSHDVDARADVYGLGATLYKLLTGTAPFETPEFRTPLSKMRALATQSAPPLLSRNPELPKGLAEIVDAMLQRDPAQRLATAADAAAALSEFASPERLPVVFDQVRKQTTQAAIPEPAPQPAVSPVPLTSVSQMAPIAATAGKRRRPVWVRLMCWSSLPAAVISGFMIWFSTGEGTLAIESEFDDIPIEIHQGSDVVAKKWIFNGENVLKLPAGNYEVVVKNDGASGRKLEFEKSKVTVWRGRTAVTRIAYADSVDLATDSSVKTEALLSTASAPTPTVNFLPFLDPDHVPQFTDPKAAFQFADAIRSYEKASSRVDELKEELDRITNTVGEQHPACQDLIRSLDMNQDMRHQALIEIEHLTDLAFQQKQIRLEKQRLEQKEREAEESAQGSAMP